MGEFKPGVMRSSLGSHIAGDGINHGFYGDYVPQNQEGYFYNPVMVKFPSDKLVEEKKIPIYPVKTYNIKELEGDHDPINEK